MLLTPMFSFAMLPWIMDIGMLVNVEQLAYKILENVMHDSSELVGAGSSSH